MTRYIRVESLRNEVGGYKREYIISWGRNGSDSEELNVVQVFTPAARWLITGLLGDEELLDEEETGAVALYNKAGRVIDEADSKGVFEYWNV